MNKIYFYASKDPYFEFSNFYVASFWIDNIEWKSVEHYFQAAKFEQTEYRSRIQMAETPMDARTLGQTRDLKVRKGWHSIKEGIMLTALRKKFEEESLKELLISTEPALLVEKSPHDNYWGAGKSGAGKNRLGVLLMQVRDELLAKHA